MLLLLLNDPGYECGEGWGSWSLEMSSTERLEEMFSTLYDGKGYGRGFRGAAVPHKFPVFVTAEMLAVVTPCDEWKANTALPASKKFLNFKMPCCKWSLQSKHTLCVGCCSNELSPTIELHQTECPGDVFDGPAHSVSEGVFYGVCTFCYGTWLIRASSNVTNEDAEIHRKSQYANRNQHTSKMISTANAS